MGIRSFFRKFKKDNFSTRVKHLEAIASRLPESNLWLDIGCGKKRYQSIFTGKFTKYIGIDLPLRKIDAGIKKNPEVYSDAEQLCFKEKVFDVIICSHVIEHIFGYEFMLKEASRVLKEGGYFILISAFLEGENEVPYDYFRFTRYGIQRILIENRFKLEYIAPGAGFWGTIGAMAYWHFMHKLPRYLVYFWDNLFKLLIQRLFLILDKIDNDEGYAQNFIILAKKIV